MISFKEFLIYLKSVVDLGIDGELDGEADEVEPASESEPIDHLEAPEEKVESDEDEDEEPEEPKISRRQAEIIKLRKERQAADEQVSQLRRELEEVKVRVSPNQAQTQEHALQQQEEAVLNNPDATDWQKYAVRAQREARHATFTSQAALVEARDLKDKTDFQLAYGQSQPKAYAAYSERIEAKVKEMRSAGGFVPARSEIFKYLLGQDVADGKLKVPSKKSDGGAKRGATPNAKSDVRSSGDSSLSEAQKRTKRLENIRI